LHFAKKTKGITVKSAGRRVGFTIHLAGGTLTITFSRPLGQASITIGPITLSANGSVESKAHKHKKVTVVLNVIDTSLHTTRLFESPKLK
jgi:hypothetical protein